MTDKEKILMLIDEIIKEAQEEPQWKAESALKCLKKELLKAQEVVEPRIVQLEEIKEGDAYWFSTLENHKTISYYAICVHREEDAGWPYITFVWQHGTSSWPMDKYGYNWCCWSSKPN